MRGFIKRAKSPEEAAKYLGLEDLALSTGKGNIFDGVIELCFGEERRISRDTYHKFLNELTDTPTDLYGLYWLPKEILKDTAYQIKQLGEHMWNMLKKYII